VSAENLEPLRQIFSGTGFSKQFFCDSWVIIFWRPDGLGSRACRVVEAVSGPLGVQGAAADVPALCDGVDWFRRSRCLTSASEGSPNGCSAPPSRKSLRRDLLQCAAPLSRRDVMQTAPRRSGCRSPELEVHHFIKADRLLADPASRQEDFVFQIFTISTSHHDFRNSSGGLAKLIASRRASSLSSILSFQPRTGGASHRRAGFTVLVKERLRAKRTALTRKAFKHKKRERSVVCCRNFFGSHESCSLQGSDNPAAKQHSDRLSPFPFRFWTGQHRPQGWLTHRCPVLGVEEASTRCAWRQLGRTSLFGNCNRGQVECATEIINRFSHICPENNKQIIGTCHFCSNLQPTLLCGR
jgi:hypothetical protein